MPKARLFPLSRDELVECAALLDARAPRRARPLRIPRAAARRAGAADRRRSRGARSGTKTRCSRWSAAPSRTATLSREEFDAVVRMLAEGFSTTPRPARRATCIATPSTGVLRGRARRAADGADLGRHDPRQRRLPRRARAAGQIDRHASTRTSRSRASPAISSSSATRRTASCGSSAAACASRMRTAQPPTHPVLARRGAGPHATSCRTPCRGCATISCAPDARSGRRRAPRWLSRRRGLAQAAAQQLVDYLARGARGARHAADAGHDRARAFLRRVRRHAARHPFAVRQPHQSRMGAGAAQALLPQVQFRAAGGGDRRRDRAVAVDQSTASRWHESGATCTRIPRATSWCRRARCAAVRGAGCKGIAPRMGMRTRSSLPLLC